MQTYTTDKTSPRAFGWLWFIRLLAMIFTLIVLGITAGDIADFHKATCSAPSRLNFNLAVSILSFLVLVYFFLATGPHKIFKLLPWIIWGQLALDAFMFVLWLAAAASSSYSCDDLCNACAGAGDVNYNSQYCVCSVVNDSFENAFKRSYSPNSRGLLEGRGPRSHNSRSSSQSPDAESRSANAAKKAFDAIMTIIFAVCLAASLFWFFKQRKTGGIAAPSDPVADAKYEEAGVPAGGATAPYSDQQGASVEYYNGQPMEQQGGHPQQSMPQMAPQQQAYHPSQAGYPASKEAVPNETPKGAKLEPPPAPHHAEGEPPVGTQ